MDSLRDIKSQIYVEPGRREEFMRIVKTRGEISGFESRVYRKNGDTIWISENARAAFDDEGRVLHRYTSSSTSRVFAIPQHPRQRC